MLSPISNAVDLYIDTKVSEGYIASIFRPEEHAPALGCGPLIICFEIHLIVLEIKRVL
jgi:hypothetical protein